MGRGRNYCLQIFEFAMSMDDSGEEDCTVYIEELKSDNPSLKLNAASKISLIGAVLGHARVKDELIPYLIQIIQQMDNDNDFLTKVAEGVLELKRNCSSPSELAALIYPLRVLASLDQPPVRDKAVSCLKQLADGQSRAFYQNHYYPLITALSKKDMAYAPKIAACCLIPSTYPQLPDSKQAELRKIFKSLALEEASPLLRRAVAENVEDFAGVVDKKIIRGDFFDIWNSLISDTFDIIKIKALECAPVVARAFKKDEVSQKMFKHIKMVDSGKKSWRVRYSLVEALVAIAPYIEKDLVKKDVVEAFEELLKDQEAEVRAISVIKLPQLTARLGQQQAWNIFFEYISKASKDGTKESVPTVKLALVEAIVPYFKTVDKAQVMEQGITILAALMKDENHVIRIGVMQRVMELGEVVGVQGTVQYLIPLIEGCLTDKKWRFKLAIAQNIPSFFKTLPYEGHKEFLDKILSTFFRDHNYAVRQQTMKSLIECSKFVDKQTFWELVQKHVNNLAGDGNYIYRVTATLFLKEIEGLDKTQLGQLLSEIIKKFQNEKVSNVLVSLLISYSQIKGNLPAQVRKEFQAYLSKIKEEKQDQDVLYYATRAQD